MIVILHPEVDNDLLESMDYYEREAEPQLALEFYTEFRRCANKSLDGRPHTQLHLGGYDG